MPTFPLRSPLRPPKLCWLAFGALAAVACSESGGAFGIDDSSVIGRDGGLDEAGVLPSVDCLAAAPGSACGFGMHCVDGRCRTNLCGDGVKAGKEECDDGNQLAGDGCTPSCRAAPLTCGDGKVQAEEECDDGNWFNLDECSDACTLNLCGNGREDGLEECDDGNRVDEDACSNGCKENRCRNGRVDVGEECDDGNRMNDDGCSNACVVLACGNGRVEGPDVGGKEECDDGNRTNEDACSNACTANACGNKRIDPGEVCDGNGLDFTCSSDCKEKLANDGCNECLEQHCRAYEMFGLTFDMIKPCLEGGSNGAWGTDDPEYVALCSDVVHCARANGCAYGPDGLQVCFCGTADVGSGACQAQGAANGPCMAEMYAAAYTTDLAKLMGDIQLVSIPIGAAYSLMECERTMCAGECAP